MVRHAGGVGTAAAFAGGVAVSFVGHGERRSKVQGLKFEVAERGKGDTERVSQ